MPDRSNALRQARWRARRARRFAALEAELAAVRAELAALHRMADEAPLPPLRNAMARRPSPSRNEPPGS
jgi:hypothetical protein